MVGLLKAMLNFNSMLDDGNGEGPLGQECAWKVLVLDSAGQNILSPILKVNELREVGVTLYLYESHAQWQA